MAATASTFTSLASSKSSTKELCSFCKERPFDLICTCGDKFDFNCIHQHVEMISTEFQGHYLEAGEKLAQLKDVKGRPGNQSNDARTAIENWKRKRLQDVNEIADRAFRDLSQRTNSSEEIGNLEEIYNDLSKHLHHIVHDTLNTVLALNQDLKAQLEANSHGPTLVADERDLDAELQSKLSPSIHNSDRPGRSLSSTASSLNRQSFPRTNVGQPPSPSIERPAPTASTERSLSSSMERPAPTASTERSPSSSIERPAPSAREEAPVVSTSRSYADYATESLRRSPSPSRELERPLEEPPVVLTNSQDSFHETATSQDDFDAGNTRYIDRRNPILIDVNNDKFAATVCSHNKELLYGDYDKTTQTPRLVFMKDFRNPASKRTIEWNPRDAPVNADDDEWIQDIIYSTQLEGYLLLNRTRLCFLPNASTDLEDYHVFSDRKMKRLSANGKFLYLTSSSSVPAQGDEIILMNYQKVEQVCKTFRDIIPSRLNRGAGPLAGEISDLAVGGNEQVILGYRLERRNEVGVCLFNVTNEGREWSCVKQLLLNDCWHSDLSYTPRIEWSEKIQNFILIEYITGHLIMVDNEGQVEGECRFMQARNRQDSPINLSITADDYLCVRYQSSIAVHQLTS